MTGRVGEPLQDSIFAVNRIGGYVKLDVVANDVNWRAARGGKLEGRPHLSNDPDVIKQGRNRQNLFCEKICLK